MSNILLAAVGGFNIGIALQGLVQTYFIKSKWGKYYFVFYSFQTILGIACIIVAFK